MKKNTIDELNTLIVLKAEDLENLDDADKGTIKEKVMVNSLKTIIDALKEVEHTEREDALSKVKEQHDFEIKSKPEPEPKKDNTQRNERIYKYIVLGVGTATSLMTLGLKMLAFEKGLKLEESGTVTSMSMKDAWNDIKKTN